MHAAWKKLSLNANHNYYGNNLITQLIPTVGLGILRKQTMAMIYQEDLDQASLRLLLRRMQMKHKLAPLKDIKRLYSDSNIQKGMKGIGATAVHFGSKFISLVRKELKDETQLMTRIRASFGSEAGASASGFDVGNDEILTSYIGVKTDIWKLAENHPEFVLVKDYRPAENSEPPPTEVKRRCGFDLFMRDPLLENKDNFDASMPPPPTTSSSASRECADDMLAEIIVPDKNNSPKKEVDDSARQASLYVRDKLKIGGVWELMPRNIREPEMRTRGGSSQSHPACVWRNVEAKLWLFFNDQHPQAWVVSKSEKLESIHVPDDKERTAERQKNIVMMCRMTPSSVEKRKGSDLILLPRTWTCVVGGKGKSTSVCIDFQPMMMWRWKIFAKPLTNVFAIRQLEECRAKESLPPETKNEVAAGLEGLKLLRREFWQPTEKRIGAQSFSSSLSGEEVSVPAMRRALGKELDRVEMLGYGHAMGGVIKGGGKAAAAKRRKREENAERKNFRTTNTHMSHLDG